MLREAELYIALMLNLEWIFIGQYPMAVIRESSEEERGAVLQCDTRDSCSTLLNRMFGWEGMSSD
jgi:hypothetical protein